MHADALAQLLYSDQENTALCHALSPWLELNELTALARVCRAFRSWVRDTGRQCFLGVMPLDCVDGANGALLPWKSHFFVDGVAHVSKRHSFHVRPCIYTCYGRFPFGEDMVMEVPHGSLVDPERTTIKAQLVHAITHECVEELADQKLFQQVKPPKGKEAPYYSYRRPVFFKILDTLSSDYTPPCMFRLHVDVFVGMHDTHDYGHYSYTSDKFWVVSTSPGPLGLRMRV